MSQHQDRQADRLVEEVARVCAVAQEPLTLLERVAALVRRQVPYRAAGWLVVDPDTLLMTAVYSEQVTQEQHLALISCELLEDDVTKFFELATRDVPAASLSGATGGDLGRSTRWRRVYQPAGYGDELRAVFRAGDATWGNACLTRAADDPDFTDAEVWLLARIGPHVGEGVRAGLLLQDAGERAPVDAPALVVLRDDGSLESATPQARAWLGPLDDERLGSTMVLHEVAQRARALASSPDGGPPARARTRSRGGDWLLVHGVRLDPDGHRAGGQDLDGHGPGGQGHGRTAVVLERARRSDIAPMLLELHQLTPREREVTQLLLRGMPTERIAGDLWISPETLRGHVKSIFGKLGVSSRPELAALLTHDPPVRVAGAG